MLDVEWNGHSQTCPKKLPKAQALAMVTEMLEEMERYTGKRPIIYTDITFHKDVLEGELPDYPHWLRSTAAEPEQRFANRKWMLWQFTSTGRVPGVQGDVDRNAFYGTPADWASFLSTDCDPREHRRLAEQGLCTGQVDRPVRAGADARPVRGACAAENPCVDAENHRFARIRRLLDGRCPRVSCRLWRSSSCRRPACRSTCSSRSTETCSSTRCPAADRALLVPHLEPTVLRQGRPSSRPAPRSAQITFPCGQTVVTLLIAMQDGRSAETATIGREGAVGGMVSAGRVPASTSAVVQIGGPTLRIDAARLQEAKRRSATLRDLFTRYADCLLAQVLQSVACNALHPIEAAVPALAADPPGPDRRRRAAVTHELLAAMLGVQRTYLTRILRHAAGRRAAPRRAAGASPSSTGAAMADAACECHGACRLHCETVLGAVYGPAAHVARAEALPATG